MSRSRFVRRITPVRLLLLVAMAGALLYSGAAATVGSSGGSSGGVVAAAGPRKALINAASVSGSPSQEEQIATALGLSVTVVDDTTWAGMTSAQFGAYDVLIVGDPSCGSVPPGVAASTSAWGPVVLGHAGGRTVAGNRVEVGTDPVLHDGGDYSSPNARGTVIREGIAYAANNVGTTGMYFDSTCGDDNGGTDTTAILAAMSEGSGAWTINPSPPCGGSVSLIAAHPSFTDLSTASLQGWSCSVHESFPTFPSDWSALAVATDTPTKPTCGVDPATSLEACGQAYVLIAGSAIVVESKVISISPLDSTNPVGTDHTVTANVHDASGAPPVAGQKVDFTVTGQNAGVTGTCAPVSCVSDVNGDVKFTYHDVNGAGDDTIKASFKDAAGALQTATAQKHWVTETGTHSLTVSVVGPGTVTSSPAGISCPGTCSTTFPAGTAVTLGSTPASGATFTGWSGDCTGADGCSVTMDADHSVTATFETTTPPPPPKRLELEGEARVCSPKIDVTLDDIEVKASGKIKGDVEIDPRHGHDFESTKLTGLGFGGDGNLAIVTGVGKYHGHSGYSFVLVAVDSGRHSPTPDVLAFSVSDSHGSQVISADLQGTCRGDVVIHEDHDAT